MAAKFFEKEVRARLKNRRALSKFLEHLILNQGGVNKAQLTYIFCTDAHLHGINLQFLQHDDYTDIITFDLSPPTVGTRLAAARSDVCGEIYISTERVAENAEKFQTTYDRELHRVIFHGALHLCGLRDKTPAEQKSMRAAEEAALEAWFAQSLK